jgi:sugar phosphate isomerase/epimerase
VTGDLADYCRANGQRLHLETGQEAADVLVRFLGQLDRDNLFVNFDPANMIMYGSGEPIAALRQLGGYVRSVHCKDARWAARPGEQWGTEVPFGEGDVGAEAFLRTLRAIGYDGPLTIEREIAQEPERQKAEIGHAILLLAELKKKIGILNSSLVHS